MRRVVFLLLTALLGCQEPPEYVEVSPSELEPYDQVLMGHEFITPESGFVPDAATAARIAEVVLKAAYEEDVLRHQRPLRVVNRDSIWVILGTLPQDFAGGVAHVEIRQQDGRILRVSHGE